MKKNDLLATVMADANEVKRVALENAKQQLAEQLSPQLKSFLSQRLAEELEEENKEEEEKEVDLEEKKSEESAEKDESEKEESKEKSEDELDEEIDLDALLAEMEKEESGEEEEEIHEKKSEESEEHEAEESEEEEAEEHKEEKSEDELDEEIDIEALLKEVEDEDLDLDEKKDEDEDSKEAGEDLDEANIADPEIIAAIATVLGVSGTLAAAFIKDMKGKSKQEKEEILKNAGKSIQSAKGIDENGESEEQLEYVQQAIEALTEANLVNAQLMYLNKLLVNYDLSPKQVNTIVEAFDKCKSVDSAKTVFETLNSTFKDSKVSKSDVAKTKKTITEAVIGKGKSNITEGSKNIQEVNPLAAMYQRIKRK